MPLHFWVFWIKIGSLICTLFECFLSVYLSSSLAFCWTRTLVRIQGFLGMILMNRNLWGLIRGTKMDRHLRGEAGLCWWMSFPGDLGHCWDAVFFFQQVVKWKDNSSSTCKAEYAVYFLSRRNQISSCFTGCQGDKQQRRNAAAQKSLHGLETQKSTSLSQVMV